MLALLAAQFLSALADNAILIAAIAIVKAQARSDLIPLLQAAFVIPFIVFAPFVGPFADRLSKGKVMLIGNAIKLVGAAAMFAGSNPLATYGLIGIGAAIYSPAKYGILAQMFGAAKLVRANGMMEGSTIVAILLGVVLGGWLADRSLTWAFAGVLAAYALATLFNLFIPRLPPEQMGVRFHPWTLFKRFMTSSASLLRNADARFSLLGTSIFWGSGSTLRLMLFAWVPAVLLIAENQTPANLMGAVSVGIVLGAVIAGKWITLENVNRALIGGLLLGPAIMALAFVHGLTIAVALMLLIGACGGLFVVPLNALLQKRGHESIGAGNALAVQNFAENSAMLLFVGVYSLAVKLPVREVVSVFGLILLLATGMLARFRLQRSRVKA